MEKKKKKNFFYLFTVYLELCAVKWRVNSTWLVLKNFHAQWIHFLFFFRWTPVSLSGFKVTLHNYKWSKLNLSGIHFVLSQVVSMQGDHDFIFYIIFTILVSKQNTSVMFQNQCLCKLQRWLLLVIRVIWVFIYLFLRVGSAQTTWKAED